MAWIGWHEFYDPNLWCSLPVKRNWWVVVFLKGSCWELGFSVTYEWLNKCVLFLIPLLFILKLTLKTNAETVKISVRVNANKLSLNIDTPYFMLSMTKSFSHCTYIVINQTKTLELKHRRFICVIIDNQLKWSAHIAYINKNI